MTIVHDFRAIVAIHDDSSRRWNVSEPLKTPVFVSYSFVEADALPKASSLSRKAETTVSFSAKQRLAFRMALDEYEKIAGVRFVETQGNDAMIKGFGVTGSGLGGWSYYPNVTAASTSSNYLVLDVTKGDRLTGFDFQIVLHELGHSLGLSHPHEGKYTLPVAEDSKDVSLMSYFWTSPHHNAPQPMDVKAMQYLYGKPIDVTGWSYSFKNGDFHASGNTGANTIMGVRGKNVLDGKGGHDILIGREKADTLKGGFGNDTLKGKAGADVLTGGAGNDELWAAGPGQTDYAANTLSGGTGDDRLYGSAGADTLRGEGGADKLFGRFGNDLLNGGMGKDDLRGDGGNDQLRGELGDDVLHGAQGNDRLFGGANNDRLFGGIGDDRAFGGFGNDQLTGGTGNDSLFGGDGADVLRGEGGQDVILGGTGNDTLFGGFGNDRLEGGPGSDTLTGGHGADVFVYKASASGARDTITDFELYVDHVQLVGTGFTSADTRVLKAGGGSDSVLVFDGAGGFSIYFEDITKQQLRAALDDGQIF